MRRFVDPLPVPPSKTRRKKDMLALQDLGVTLAALDPAKLRELHLPEPLEEAILATRSITKHEARRRQLQYVGRLMRDVDPEPIEVALKRLDSLSSAERARFASAEHWRDRLLEDDLALVDFIAAHPAVDRIELTELVREARAERASGRPPHKFRALFRRISQLTQPEGTR